MKYDILLIESDPRQNLKGACLRDMIMFLNYCRSCIGVDDIRSSYVLTNTSLGAFQQRKFSLPIKRHKLSFGRIKSSKTILDVIKKIHDESPYPLIVYISGHGGQIEDTGRDERDGKDEYIPAGNGMLVDDELTAALMHPTKRVICVTDTCHSGTLLDLNYAHNEEEFYLNRESLVPETPTYYFGSCIDGSYSYCTPEGSTFTMAVVKHNLFEEFLKSPCLKTAKCAYQDICYMMRSIDERQECSMQVNFIDN